MRKKSIVTLLAFLSALGFTLGASACDFKLPFLGGSDGEQAVVEGFEVKETLEVSVGSVIELENPVVTDSKGVLLDCWSYVTDDNGNYVATSAGSFTADVAGTYTIIYVVRDSDNNTFQKTTVVTVKGAGEVSGEITLSVDYEQFVTVGETVAIDAVCSDENAELSYVVKRFSTGAELTVEGNEFVPKESGIYEIWVTANENAAVYKYNLFAETPMQKGEVETFQGAWAEKEQFVGGKRQDWEITTSEESGITDPYGRNVTLAKYTTNRHYIPLYINIREDVDYYKQLAEEGYTHVSTWIYMDSEKKHMSISDRDPNGGFYRREGPDLQPGQWTEFRLRLLDGTSSWMRSFTTCYDTYDNQSHFYLQVDNSYEYNPWGVDAEITFYFTDIYAIKDVTIDAADGVETAKNVGDTVDFSTAFSADFPLEYAVSHHGEKSVINGSAYKFTANGEFTVEAIPATYDLRGSTAVGYSISDEQIISASNIIKERTGESATVSVSELNASYSEVNGVTPTVEAYRAFYKGEQIELVDGEFQATKDGSYEIEIKGVYSVGDEQYATYHTVSVDVWSTATKFSVIDYEAMKLCRAWDWGNPSLKSAYGEYTVGSKTGEYIKATSNSGIQSLIVFAKPFYSKAYYEALYAENSAYVVDMDTYHIPEKSGGKTNFWSVFQPTVVAYTDDEHNNRWLTYSMTLKEFISKYDSIVGEYEANLSTTGGVGETGANTSAWIFITGGGLAHEIYFNAKIGLEATETSVALKDGAAFTVDADNDLNEILDVTLDGNVGEIVEAEVYFNNEWVALENCVFNPAWEVNYQFRLRLQTTDGLIYKTVEETFAVGDGSFTATVDDGFYSAKVGETFDVTALLTGDYQYSVKLFRSISGKQTLVGEFDDGVIDTTELSAGAYTVNVYANDGDGAFSQILYYSLTLDVWTDEMKYAVLDTDNIKVVRAWNWGSTSFKVSYQEYTVGGRTGDYLRAVSNSGSQSLIIYARPLYSKAYYEALYAENSAFTVGMDTYHIPGTANGKTSFWSVFQPTVVSYTDDEHNNRWLTYSKTLEEFISNYDSIANKYEEKKSVTDGDGESGANTFAWIYITGGGLSHEIYLNASVRSEATEATAVMKDGAAFTVDAENDLNELLNVTVDGVQGVISSAEVYFNNEWVVLENSKFNPAWEISYDFRLNVRTADGSKYKEIVVTLAVGDGSFATTNDTSLHAVKLGETFDFSNLTTADYDFEIVALSCVKGVWTEFHRSATETTISTVGLDVGSYKVKVYASKGENAFSDILYYELTLDVWTEDMKYAVLDTNNMRTIRAWDWDNAQTTAEYGEYTVGDVTGNFVKATAKGQSLVTYVRPLYSKAYYQAILDDNAAANLKIDVYFTPAVTGADNNFRSIYNPSKSEWFDTYNDQWQTYEMTLSAFLSVYDDVSGKYEQYANASYGADTSGYQGSWIQFIGSWIGRTVYFNVTLNA